MSLSEPSASFEDRRSHPRVTLKAYGFNHVCGFVRLGRRHQASLVDVSPGGPPGPSRRRPPISPNDQLTLDLRLAAASEDLSAVPARFAGPGARFRGALRARAGSGHRELQELLSR
jgi:hypothetical protein